MNENTNPDDVLSILVASDIHLGYNEKDPLRGTDSFKTFEEILHLAKQRDVDFILLGGDLFHEAKPTQNCLHRALCLLRRYCMGDKPVAVEFLSDQSVNFSSSEIPVVNYEDPNLNVAIPVFSIHGNHDDPSGYGHLSTLDLLSASGLVNYFGRWTNLKEISVTPLLMRKGETKLALYGLSYIKDERLCRLFRDRKVQLYQPKEDTDEWFNIFMLHQNRADRGINRSLPEDALPKFLDVVIWGHEHECRIVPEVNPIQGFSVIQPGSPVATSLCEGEAVRKRVGILKIYKKKFEFEPINLRTVRPFVMDTVVLSRMNITYISNKESEAVQEYVADHIRYMLEKAKDQISGHSEQPVLPLIRLRVEYNDEKQVFNPLRFGLQFSSDCANPRDIVLLKKERLKRENKDSTELDTETMKDVLERAREAERVETVVERYFADVAREKGLKVLSVKGLNEGVSSFTEKADNDAISDLILHQLKKTSKFIKDNLDDDTDTDKIIELLGNYRTIRSKSSEDDAKEVKQLLSDKSRKSKPVNSEEKAEVMIVSDSDSDDGRLQASSSTGRGRGSRGRGRGSRGGKQVNGTTNKSRAGTASGTKASGRGKKQLDISQTTIMNSFQKKKNQMKWSDSDSD